MLVTRQTFEACLARFSEAGAYGLDTETTGLEPYKGHRLFSLILSDANGACYFNFQDYPDLVRKDCVLGDEHKLALHRVFNNPGSTWFVANAKFDLAMLAAEGIFVQGIVHCTEACGRVEANEHFAYGLDACAKRLGLAKSDAVADYIAAHNLYRLEPKPGEYTAAGAPKMEKVPEFWRVPLSVIVPYGEQDATLVRAIGLHQVSAITLSGQRQHVNWPKPANIMAQERELTRVAFQMERVGVKIDRAYCEAALAHERSVMADAIERWKVATGNEIFLDSWKHLSEAFDKFGIEYPRTEPTKTRPKGTPSFNDEWLESVAHPAAQAVRDYRGAAKKANTYYENFLYYADENDVVHANIRQGGTATGRMSYSAPNLQNLNKEEDTSKKYLVRRAFVPRPDFCFVMIDYRAMEFRLMLDYANEASVIEKIRRDGLDVHQATADKMGVNRTAAKTLNFMLLYGGGVGELAASLGITFEKAHMLREQYFAALPNVSRFIENVKRQAKQRGFIFNWAGRIYNFPDASFSYKAPNYLIQGGCSDIVKKAMNTLSPFLFGLKSRMLLQIHDEILFEVHKSELDIVPQLAAILEGVYPAKHLPMETEVSYSWKSWADKIAGLPSGEIPRNAIQGSGAARASPASTHLGGEDSASLN